MQRENGTLILYEFFQSLNLMFINFDHLPLIYYIVFLFGLIVMTFFTRVWLSITTSITDP